MLLSDFKKACSTGLFKARLQAKLFRYMLSG